MSLSVCCLTAAPAQRLIAALTPLRGIASEIVLAIDARAHESSLADYAAIADRVIPVDYEPPFERYLAWLHGLCRGDWILRLDGDEVASGDLIDELPDLIRRRDVLQYHAPCRWVYPRPDCWLDEWPWSPDHHNRLVRRDALLWFPGQLHSGASATFPSEYLDASIYHLDLVLNDRPSRLAKVARYRSISRSLWPPEADDATDRIYLPEDHATLAPVDVPWRDREILAAVLDAGTVGPESRLGAGVVESRVRVAEVDPSWTLRPLRADAWRARLESADGHRRLAAGEHRPFRLRVTNRGGELWPGGERQPQIRLAYKWLDRQGKVLVPEGFRSPLPAPLGPGHACFVSAIVAAPDVPGDYSLEFDLVHEGVRWFGAALRLPMRVEAAS